MRESVIYQEILQQNSLGFPHLVTSERPAHDVQVGEEWRDGGSMEPSHTRSKSYDYDNIDKSRKLWGCCKP